jgi:RimJ/RimL family protein N-acetyltransferase
LDACGTLKPAGAGCTEITYLAVFAYAFLICGVERVSGYVDASNLEARRFNEHLGFREEARLQGAAADGGDVVLYVLWKRDCRFIAGEV